MHARHLFIAIALAAAALSGCTSIESALPETAAAPEPRPAAEGKGLNGLIDAYAAAYDVPPTLVHRVVKRESNYNPQTYSSGNWGLMQIRHKTAEGMGYRGTAKGLLDAETNLKYAVKYLRGAYLVAGGNHDKAVQLYARGYYYDAKRKGLLEETGLRGDEVQVASLPAADAGETQADEAKGEPGIAVVDTAVAAAPADDATSARVAAAAEASGGDAAARPGEAPAVAEAATAGQPGPGMTVAAAPASDAEGAPAMSFAGGTPTAPQAATFQFQMMGR